MWTMLSVAAARRSSLGGAGGADWRQLARPLRRGFGGATRSPVDGALTLPVLGFLGGGARVAPPPAPLRTPEQQSSMWPFQTAAMASRATPEISPRNVRGRGAQLRNPQSVSCSCFIIRISQRQPT